MRAEDLKLAGLVRLGEGVFDLHGRRLVLHSLHAFAQLRKDLFDSMGPEQARRIFTRFGHFWGQADAAAMKRIFQWDSLEEWLRAGPRMHTLQGVTRAVVKSLEVDAAVGRFTMAVTWHDSGEAEEHLLEFGPSREPVCWMLVGYASGYASFCLGREVYFIEQTCRAAGARLCSALGRDRASWDATLVEHLPYFEADDIHPKVLDLTAELQRQTELLARQRRRVERLERATRLSPVEVRSDAYARVLDVAARVARYDTSVLITGESGVGKEVLARYIHGLSQRATGPFIAINCTALPETLLESELFGHRRGAFTGATQDRAGLFEEADSGTVLLDEIGDITPALQQKLLRVLQEREVLRVGENSPRKIDIRVLATTNRDIRQAVNAGTFREDLYYRLGVVELEIPPLRERPEDILPLARHFVREIPRRLKLAPLTLDATCLDHLVHYAWPGNVRQLENAIERAAVMCRDNLIRPEDLPAAVLTATVRAGRLVASGQACSLAALGRQHIAAVLRQTGGNRKQAARILGISTTTLWRRLRETRS